MYKRDWLNEKGNAFIVVEAEESSSNWRWCDLTIHDCNRGIILDFGFQNDNQEDRDKAIKKLNIIREYLDSIEQYIIDNPLKNKS